MATPLDPINRGDVVCCVCVTGARPRASLLTDTWVCGQGGPAAVNRLPRAEFGSRSNMWINDPPVTRQEGRNLNSYQLPMATLATATRAAPIATPAAPAPAAKRNADAEAHDRRAIGIGIAVA